MGYKLKSKKYSLKNLTIKYAKTIINLSSSSLLSNCPKDSLLKSAVARTTTLLKEV